MGDPRSETRAQVKRAGELESRDRIPDELCSHAPTPGSPALRIITRHDGALVGRVLVDGSPLTGESVEKEALRLACEGLGGLHLYALAGIRDDAWQAVDRSDVPVTLFDLGDDGNPLNSYCNC